MTKKQYSDDDLRAAVCTVTLMRSAGILPVSNAATFLGYVTDYLLDEWHLGETNERWHALQERLGALYPHLRGAR